MKVQRQRADKLLVERGLCESRTQAQAAVLAGQVRVGADHVIAKASELVAVDADLRLNRPSPYVSRGAGKLAPPLGRHLPSLDGLTALDVGASTGGFTDLMLQCGAARVYAVDVGRGQLHLRLREDPRVVVLEGVNARYLSAAEVPDPVDVVTADLSFISLLKVMPAVAPLLCPGGLALLLIKPQFEAERHEVGKGGIVRDDAVREAIVARVDQGLRAIAGWSQLELAPSAVAGSKGNIEFVGVYRCDG
jgi:23S rRNA (cytidine1920-2'-O)/16S rRNA (cytidine1409-2'-O)-methyltransferase